MKKLRTSEYRRLFEASQEGIVILDAGTQEIIDANPFLARLVGYSREQVLGKKLWEIEAFRNLKTQVDFEKLRKKKVARIDALPLEPKGKGTVIIELVTTTYEINDRQVIQCNIHDVTERKQAEETIRESEGRIRSILETAVDGIITINEQGLIQSFNPAAERLFGYKVEEVKGQNVNMLMPIPCQSEHDSYINSYLKTGVRKIVGVTREVVGCRKDGTTFPIDLSVGEIKTTDNKRTFTGIIRDITDRRRAEEELRASEESYRSLFDGMLDGMYRSTHEGRFVDVNSAFVRMFGYSSKQEVLDIADIRKALYFAPEERGSHILDTGQEEVDVYRMRRKDRSEIWVEDHGRYVHDDKGKIVYHEGILRDVTERRRMEGEVRDMARFPAENPNPVLRLDAHGSIVVANEASRELLKSWSSEVGQVAPKYWCDLASEALSSGQWRHVGVELNERFYEFLIKPIMEASYVNFYGRDITERRQIEQALGQSEERFRMAMEATSDGLWDWNVETGEIYFSPAYYRMLGYEPNEFPPHQQSWMNLIHPEDRDRALEINQDCIENQTQNFSVEFRMKAKNGQWKWILGRGRATSRPPNGRALRMIGTHQDITERKRMEEHLEEMVKQRTKELSESEEKFRGITERSFDVVATLELDGVISYISPAVTLLMGYRSTEMMGKSFQSYLSEQYIHNMTRSLTGVAKGEIAKSEDFELVRKDGSMTHVEANASPVFKENRIVGIQLIIRDVSEKFRLAELRDQFISSVTHELRTPLVSIKGYVDLVLSTASEKLPDDVDSNLKVVRRNTDRLLSLVDDLLDIRRMESGKLQLNIQPTDFLKIITNCLTEIQPLITQRKLSIIPTVPEGPLMVDGDEVRLTQVLMNLLVNATKFSPEGGEITLHVTENDGTVKVSVSDNGIGLKKEDLPRVFEPFAFIQKPTWIKGTGLGLSVSKGIVEAHGGKIRAESGGEGKGATFTFTLPKQKENE